MIRRARALAADATGSTRVVVVIATVLGALALVAPAIAAAASAGGLAARNAAAVAGGDVDAVHLADATTFGEILVRNLTAAATLVAGAPLAALPTVVGSIVLGFGVGAGMHAVVGALGPGETAARVLAYAPLELTGIVIAAAAGFAPLVAVVLDRVRPGTQRSTSLAVLHGLGIALRLAAVAVACLVVAAGVEALLISRSTIEQGAR